MTAPRCYKHKAATELPRLCGMCQRIAVEQEIVIATVDGLLAAGYALASDEGEHRFFGDSNPSKDRDAILASLMQTDDEHLGVFDATEATGVSRFVKPHSWVRFVYGNDGYDVISDYTTNLEDALSGAQALAEQYDK